MPEHVGFGEHQPGVNDQDILVILQHHQVFSDLADAAERNDTQGKSDKEPP